MSIETAINIISPTSPDWRPNREVLASLLSLFQMEDTSVIAFRSPLYIHDMGNTLSPVLDIDKLSPEQALQIVYTPDTRICTISMLSFMNKWILECLLKELELIPPSVDGDFIPDIVTITYGPSKIVAWDDEDATDLIHTNFVIRVSGQHNPPDIPEYLEYFRKTRVVTELMKQLSTLTGITFDIVMSVA